MITKRDIKELIATQIFGRVIDNNHAIKILEKITKKNEIVARCKDKRMVEKYTNQILKLVYKNSERVSMIVPKQVGNSITDRLKKFGFDAENSVYSYDEDIIYCKIQPNKEVITKKIMCQENKMLTPATQKEIYDAIISNNYKPIKMLVWDVCGPITVNDIIGVSERGSVTNEGYAYDFSAFFLNTDSSEIHSNK